MLIFNKRPLPYYTFYKYLRCNINEFFYYSYTAKIQSDSAGRALSSKITKMIKNQGFPFRVYIIIYQYVSAVLVSMPVKCLGLSNMSPH